MPSYLVTGASRGLGYAFIPHLASSPSNKVIGLVRNKAATEAKLEKDGIKNVTILQADITDLLALKAAAVETAKITGGSLDILINNAAYIPDNTLSSTMLDCENDLDEVERLSRETFETNVVGIMRTVHAFLPLIKKSFIKKVITISSGMADLEFVNQFDIPSAPPYAASKAAVNLLVAKYNVVYKKDGILFMSISPGLVNTIEGRSPTEEELTGLKAMIEQFSQYSPDWKGPISPQESVEDVVKVIDKASVERGDGGSFVSHWGNKRWL